MFRELSDIERRPVHSYVFMDGVHARTVSQPRVKYGIKLVYLAVYAGAYAHYYFFKLFFIREVFGHAAYHSVFFYKYIPTAVYHDLAYIRLSEIFFKKIELAPECAEHAVSYTAFLAEAKPPEIRTAYYMPLHSCHDRIVVKLAFSEIQLPSYLLSQLVYELYPVLAHDRAIPLHTLSTAAAYAPDMLISALPLFMKKLSGSAGRQ